MCASKELIDRDTFAEQKCKFMGGEEDAAIADRIAGKKRHSFMARSVQEVDINRENIGSNCFRWFSSGEKGTRPRSLRLEPVPRQQKSPWFRTKTVVFHPRKSFFWWNGGLAGTRTLDQCLKRALLYQLSYQPTIKHLQIIVLRYTTKSTTFYTWLRKPKRTAPGDRSKTVSENIFALANGITINALEKWFWRFFWNHTKNARRGETGRACFASKKSRNPCTQLVGQGNYR